MFAFASMLVPMAKAAGMAVPEDPEHFDSNEYPHFAVFTVACLDESMPYPSCQWDNAEVVAKVPESEIRLVTMAQLIERGLQIGTPIP